MAKSKKRPSLKSEPPSNELVMTDDTIRIRIQGGPNDGQVVTPNLVGLKLAIEGVETRHKVGQGFKTNLPFLQDMAKAIQEAGVPGCNPTMAYQLWLKVYELWAQLKNPIA